MKRYIKDFKPNRERANKIVKKRVFPYFYSVLIFFFILLTIFIILTIFDNNDVLPYLTMILTALSFLTLITVAWIFDFGPAAKIRKENFEINGIKNMHDGHTYYYALKKIGLYRILINSSLIILCIVFGIISII